MKLPLLVLSLCLTISSGLSQNLPPIKFGEVSLEELKMTGYEPDSSASAIVLCDFGETVINYTEAKGFTLTFERTKRIKILKKEGLEWADFQIPLYYDDSNDEKISSLKAVTYNLENGKIVGAKVKSDGLFKEKSADNINVVKVALPNVKVGSVIEITYIINSDFLMNFWGWEFQETIPVIWSEYRASIPEFFHYGKFMQGYIPLHITDEKVWKRFITIPRKERIGNGFAMGQNTFSIDQIDVDVKRFRWVAKDVPAFKPEPFITTSKDYILKINFELNYIQYPNQPIEPVLGTWEEINRKYIDSENFGKVITGNIFLTKTVDDITRGMTSNEKKIAAIVNYVRANVSWNGNSSKVVDGSLRKVLDNRNGSSAEINFLVASMLEKADIKVHPVLISTRDHGFVREAIPVTTQFNYVICMTELNGKQILLDATDNLLPIGLVPERCLNGNGLVISAEGHAWIKLTSPQKSKSYMTVDLAFNSELALKGNVSLDRSGYSAYRGRKNYRSKAEKDYVNDLVSSQGWEISKSEFKNVKDIDQIFTESHDVIIYDHVASSGDVIFLNPFVTTEEGENPFKSETREYPVDFGSPFERIYIARIVMPPGYAPEELPSPEIFLLPEDAGRFVFNVVVNGGVINVTSRLQINKSLFIQDEYPDLRKFFDLMISKQAEQIVLKRK